MRIGLISDTHDLLREEALAFLWGCDQIIHAGDIGRPDILAALQRIAPVAAVRGNNDTGVWANVLPEVLQLRMESTSIYVLHDMAQLDLQSLPAGISVVICGHSHRAIVQRRDGVIYINPGSAGPRRFNLPISVGELIIHKHKLTPRIISLDVAADARRRIRPAVCQHSFI
ncbi:MAG: metallophosphoesterase family protein [Steroidobacteraceae bacterium]